MSKMKDMYSNLLVKVESFCMKALVKSGISIDDLGSADDESTLMLRDGLKLYGEVKEACIEYVGIIDHQQEQIDKLVELVTAQQKQMEELGNKLDKLAKSASTKKVEA